MPLFELNGLFELGSLSPSASRLCCRESKVERFFVVTFLHTSMCFACGKEEKVRGGVSANDCCFVVDKGKKR